MPRTHDAVAIKFNEEKQSKERRRRNWKSFKLVEDQAKIIDQAQGEIRRLTSQNIFLIGQQLNEAQERLAKFGEGTFIKWCKLRLGLKKTTAYKWIRVVHRFSDCPQCVQSIEPSALYLLSESKTPGKAKRQAIEETKEGKVVTLARAKELIQSTKDLRSANDGKPRQEVLAEMKLCLKRLRQLVRNASEVEIRAFERLEFSYFTWRGYRYRCPLDIESDKSVA